jgi:predicted TIM-barrel fold metal-dependent hydrolase
MTFERRMPAVQRLTEEDLEAAGLKARGRYAGMTASELFAPRLPGGWDVQLRLEDLDQEGIWAEVVYPSIGLWNGLIKDPVLYREGVRVFNDWVKETFIDVTPRCVPPAGISTRSVDDAIAETARAAEMGFQAIQLPQWLDNDMPNWNDRSWEPLWSSAEEAGMVLAIHAGSDHQVQGRDVHIYHGDGAAVLNYWETSFGLQRFAAMMVGSGVLDRHQGLRVLVSEGGATWVPFAADRLTEAYRQHGIWARPKLSRTPTEILFEQVYASFQHDKSAVHAYTAMGYRNVLWGSDYPHAEGTFGHTQETLHELFDDIDEEARHRMTRGAFLELFPHVGEPPEAASNTQN